jgi:anti-sigma regulatory factor (Ser/Thr protein kinase)/serine/threonine protein phosphatase PrpC
MGTILIARWLGQEARLRVIDESSVAVVREKVRDEGRALGLPDTATAALVNVASELGHNQIAHAGGGEMAIRRIERANIPGLEVIAADCGPGMASPTDALQGVSRSGGGSKKGLGVGVHAVVELSDETDFDIRIGEGTCVWARKFAQAVPRRRQIGIYGRACPNEDVSGDDGTFLRGDDSLVLTIADGLGHGALAREAAALATETLASRGADPVDQALLRCHDALRETRGAVMAVAKIREPGNVAVVGCVGNVSVHVYGVGAARRFAGPSFVLGAAGRTPKVFLEEQMLAPSDAVVLFTDGLTTKTDLEGELDLVLREHPIRIAHRLLERFGRENDDALVLVAR